MAELAQMETGQPQNGNLEQLVLELAGRLQNTKGQKGVRLLAALQTGIGGCHRGRTGKDERVAAAYDLWNQMRGGGVPDLF